MGCPYCDSQGLTYIEASDNVIVEILKQADEDLKQKILQKALGINYETLLELSSSYIAD